MYVCSNPNDTNILFDKIIILFISKNKNEIYATNLKHLPQNVID